MECDSVDVGVMFILDRVISVQFTELKDELKLNTRRNEKV